MVRSRPNPSAFTRNVVFPGGGVMAKPATLGLFDGRFIRIPNLQRMTTVVDSSSNRLSAANLGRQRSQLVPLYEYVCRKCSSQFEALIYGDDKAACPACES